MNRRTFLKSIPMVAAGVAVGGVAVAQESKTILAVDPAVRGGREHVSVFMSTPRQAGKTTFNRIFQERRAMYESDMQALSDIMNLVYKPDPHDPFEIHLARHTRGT